MDFLVLIVPGGNATYRSINAEVLKALEPTGFVINVARGSVMNQEALQVRPVVQWPSWPSVTCRHILRACIFFHRRQNGDEPFSMLAAPPAASRDAK